MEKKIGTKIHKKYIVMNSIGLYIRPEKEM